MKYLTTLMMGFFLLGNTANATPVSETLIIAQAETDKMESDMDQGEVARAVFTSAVEDREPVDKVTTLNNDHDKIVFFTDVRNMSGHIVTHRWIYQGETMAEVEFGIGGPRWRVWSSKSLLPKWTGEWTVEVVDEQGNVIDEAGFTYTETE
jgi:hypothetical protein